LAGSGLKLTWKPMGGGAEGSVKTTEIRAVAYGAAASDAPTRFVVETKSGPSFSFTIADARKLHHFVCGLRHLAQQPLERRQFLWQRTAAMNREVVAAGSFDSKLSSFSGFLQSTRSTLHT